MWYVYVLVSERQENWHYYGFTSDLKSRFEQHSSGLVKSTSKYLPVTLKYYEAYDNESSARKRESNLKKSRSATKALHARI